MTASRTNVPVALDLFHQDGTGVSLVGSHCAGCGTYYFPRGHTCRNPACEAVEVTEARFGREGRLHSWTVQVYQPPAPFRMEPWEPHLIALVDLPEGLRVLSMLTGCSAEDVRIDMPVELTTRTMYRAEDGADVVTYAYRPVADSTGTTPTTEEEQA